MVTALALNALMLALIALMLAVTMLMAWRNFGRPAHALTWSLAFAVSAIHWSAILVQTIVTGAVSAFQVFMPWTLIGRAALLYVGFRQRAGRHANVYRVAGAWAVASLACLVLSVAGWRMPMIILADVASALFHFAVIPLVGLAGRRRTIAEWGSVIAVLVVGGSQIAIGVIDATGPFGPAGYAVYRGIASVVVPTSVAAIGLFCVFLIASDLSMRMKRLAQTDLLTGLLNRRGLDDAVSSGSRRRWRQGVAVMADLDAFKRLNDRFGHEAGDSALRAFAARARTAVGPGDVVARTGGEEFAILLPGQTVEQAAIRIEALRSAIEAIRLPGYPEVRISASFGMAPFGPDEIENDMLSALARADAALLRAKARGRNRIVCEDRDHTTQSIMD